MGRIFKLCRYSLASMALGTLPLVVAPQGRDLATALADASGTWHRVFFFVTLVLWSLSVWYWSRVLLDGHFAETAQPYHRLARALPRWLGALTLLLPAIPIWLATSPVGTRVVLSLGCVSLALAFWVSVGVRRRWLRDKHAVERYSVAHAFGRPAGRIAAMSIVVSLALFVWFVWWPLPAGRLFGAIAILFVAAANAVMFGSIAVFLSANRRWLKIDLLALGAAAIFSFFNDNHRVDVQAHSAPVPNLEQLFTDWLERIDKTLTAGARRPVFLVAAEGGGIRAAYWTATVLSDLADTNPSFGGRVFAVSGISGGSMGAALYAAARQDGVRPPELRNKIREVLDRADLLAPTLAKAVTGDVAQWFIPFAVHKFDRSTAMEQALTAMYQGSQSGIFSQSYFDLRVSPDLGVPAMIFNSTGVESGGRVVMAPFSWRPDQIPEAESYYEKAGNAAPSLAAAVHNSARFTYISPAGLITPKDKTPGHVVDGGYFDPTGGDTLLDVYRVLEPIAAKAGVSIIPIFITNGRIPRDANSAVLTYARGQVQPPTAPQAQNLDTQRPTDGIPQTNVALYGEGLAGPALLGELFSPIRAVLASRQSHGRLAIGRQRLTPGAVAFGFCDLAGAPLRPPLGWALSTPMEKQLNDFWDRCPVNETGREALQLFTRGR